MNNILKYFTVFVGLTYVLILRHLTISKIISWLLVSYICRNLFEIPYIHAECIVNTENNQSDINDDARRPPFPFYEIITIINATDHITRVVANSLCCMDTPVSEDTTLSNTLESDRESSTSSEDNQSASSTSSDTETSRTSAESNSETEEENPLKDSRPFMQSNVNKNQNPVPTPQQSPGFNKEDSSDTEASNSDNESTESDPSLVDTILSDNATEDECASSTSEEPVIEDSTYKVIETSYSHTIATPEIMHILNSLLSSIQAELGLPHEHLPPDDIIKNAIVEVMAKVLDTSDPAITVTSLPDMNTWIEIINDARLNPNISYQREEILHHLSACISMLKASAEGHWGFEEACYTDELYAVAYGKHTQ